jgi:hypothetical protein
MSNLFQIESFEKNPSNIIVTICSNEKGLQDLKVNRSKFESYLDRHGILQTPMQMHDDEGSTELAVSTMTLTEYYDNGNVEQDLYNYILISKGERLFGMAMHGLSSILSEYRN